MIILYLIKCLNIYLALTSAALLKCLVLLPVKVLDFFCFVFSSFSFPGFTLIFLKWNKQELVFFYFLTKIIVWTKTQNIIKQFLLKYGERFFLGVSTMEELQGPTKNFVVVAVASTQFIIVHFWPKASPSPYSRFLNVQDENSYFYKPHHCCSWTNFTFSK